MEPKRLYRSASDRDAVRGLRRDRRVSECGFDDYSSFVGDPCFLGRNRDPGLLVAAVIIPGQPDYR